PFGDDIDHGQERIAPIQRRTGPADDLHTFDEVHIDQPVCPHIDTIVDIFIEAMPIDHYQDAAIVITCPAETAHAHITVVAVIGHIKTAHTAQNISESTEAKFFDFLRRDSTHRGGGFSQLLLVFRSAVYRG